MVVGVAEAGRELPSVAVWIAALSLFGLLIRQLVPMLRLKQEGDASLRADLLKRIGDLEKQMSDERKECDRRIGDLEEQIKGLVSMIRQNSQSTAYVMSDPEGAAITKAARKSRGEE